MEENQNSSLFGLSIDPAARAHLSEAARWARFLAIIGFIFIGLIVIFGLLFGSIFGAMTSQVRPDQSMPVPTSAFGGFFAVLYVIVALIYFFPCLYLFRFANKMRTALAANDQDTLNGSFQNLKILYRYLGIFTIIILAIYACGILFSLLGAGLSR